MPIHFSRSLRRLESERSRRLLVLLSFALILLVAWIIWSSRAQITLLATSTNARLEVETDSHIIDTPVAGRVRTAPPAPGTVVREGDILLELDAQLEQLEREESIARLSPTGTQLASLERELAAERAALASEERAAEATQLEATAKVREASVALEIAREEAGRLQSLVASGLISELEAIKAAKLAEVRQSEVDAATFAATRLASERATGRQTRLARIARLENDLAVAGNGQTQATAAANRLTYEIERRTVRATTGGTVAEVSALKVGNSIEAGSRICTIIPDGTLKVVAHFAPGAALGRIHRGQDARLRLEGFPWTRYGSLAATVTSVDGEVRNDTVRVELRLTSPTAAPVPLQHGIPADVDVEVERTSPLALVLRSAGDYLHREDASRISR